MYLKDLPHSSFVKSETQLDKKRITNLQRVWDLSLEANVASAVTVSNGVLYFGDWNGVFHALDAGTGTEIWQRFVGKAPDPDEPGCDPGIGVTSQPTVLGNTVYVGGGDSAVYALDRASGNLIWRVPLADPASGSYLWSSIVPYQNSLYLGIASLGDCPLVRGAVARIDPQNPQQPLVRYLVAEDAVGAGVWSTPAIDTATNTVFVTTGNAEFGQPATPGNWTEAALSLDATTLAIKSHYMLSDEASDSDLDWGSSPTLFTPAGGVPMMAATGKDGFLYGLRQQGLSLAWKTYLAVGCPVPLVGCGSLSTPAFDGATLFVGAGVRDPDGFTGGSVYAIQPSDGSVVWEHDTDAPVIAPVTVANGLVFVSTMQGLEIYDAETGQLFWNDRKRGPIFSQPVVVDGTIFSTYVLGDVIAWAIPPADQGTLYSFSAASGLPSSAPEAIASAFGSNLADAQVTVQDSAGTQREAHVLFSSASQLNYVIPGEASGGRGAVVVTTTTGDTLSTALQISDVAPGIFSANGDGKGVAAAQLLVVNADGSASVTPVFQCGVNPGSCVARPIDWFAANARAFLILYGTGLRGLASPDRLSCTMGGVAAPVLYIGPQNGFEGLDQVSVEIPQTLKGRGEVNVRISVDGQLSNVVTVSVK